MSVIPDSTLADPKDRLIAELQRQLAASNVERDEVLAERDEALEQQIAIAEVLQVINSSPGDVVPVFDAMLEKAMRLCDAAFGLMRISDGSQLRIASTRGVPAAYAEFLSKNPLPAGQGGIATRIAGGDPFVHIVDLKNDDRYWRDDVPTRRAMVDLGGARTSLSVALKRDRDILGAIHIYRQEVRPFTDKQITLLQSFAVQAVIAMENARLLTETREALDQQTATTEVLQIINSSPGDLAPVFDAILEKAHSLCGIALGELELHEGGKVRAVAMRGVFGLFAELLRQPFAPPPGSPPARLIAGESTVQINDVSELARDRPDDPRAQAGTQHGLRTALFVPLRKDNVLLGYITGYRREVRPFSEKEIALLQNFAAQAVIAMENTRLITETREALEQQTATAAVLQVINASPGDLAPVFDTMLEKATRLCEAAFGIMSTYDGEHFHGVARHDVPSAYLEYMGNDPPQPSPESALGRIRAGEHVVHIEDYAQDQAEGEDNPRRRALAELGGARSYIAVGLFKDDKLLGTIAAYRQEVRPFTEKQIALLQNFAAQAVIAMENARLLTETREALEQQTATAKVLQVINSSPGNLAPVFDEILDKAMQLCEADFGQLHTCDGEDWHTATMRGLPSAYAEYRARTPPIYGPGTGPARLMQGETVVHIKDIADSEAYRAGEPARRALADLGGAHSYLAVALRKDATLLGAITIFRQEVRPFSDKQIALVQNFAAQAVIAIENARLITETREALEQQTATSEILQVVNSSPGDLTPVFDAMLDKALRYCGADFGMMNAYDGERFHHVADRGVPEAYAQFRRHRGPTIYGPGTTPARLVAGENLVHTLDLMQTEAYQQGDPNRRAMVDLGRARCHLTIALRKGDTLLGDLSVYREEVHPFTDKQIALLQNFAGQAVIAIENARLLEELRQRQQELRVTFDNMADGVAMFDEALRLAAWNRNFQELLDLPDTVLTERLGYDEYLRMLADRGEFGTEDIETELNRRLEHTDQELRLERTRPDGQIIEVRRNAVPDGGFVLIYSDITERKRSEADIRAARDAAEATLRDLRAAQSSLIQAQKMAALGQLTAGIAHEIKNPLNFVNNFAGLSIELLDELKEIAGPVHAQADPDIRAEIDETIELLTGNLDKIAEHGRRADNIVKSMLEHSRGVTSERREVDLNNLIEEALNLAYHGARAQDQSFGITLDRDYECDLAQIELVPQEMSRVFINLIGNGFYAMTKRRRENGGPHFQPALTVTTRDFGDAVEVRVRDNGTGIPPEIRDRLFQPFFTTKPTGEGTGLGLSISYDIITQQHGGTITVESEPGAYTEFTIRLPRRAATGDGA